MEPETFMTEIKEMISSLVTTTEAVKGANALMKNKIIGVCPNCGASVVGLALGALAVLQPDPAIPQQLVRHMSVQPLAQTLEEQNYWCLPQLRCKCCGA